MEAWHPLSLAYVLQHVLYIIEHRAVSLIVILVFVVLCCILHPMITSFVILHVFPYWAHTQRPYLAQLA